MGLFAKNPNETNYVGGKKHFLDVIKNRGGIDDLVYLNPEEDFNNNSVLIVNEAEEALFCKDGVIEQVFGGGRYELKTENYPFISRLTNSLSGGISTFNCKVYFVRMENSKPLRWGTSMPVQVYDAQYQMTADVGANGSYVIRVVDSKLLYVKLMGSRARAMTAGYVEQQLEDVVSEEIIDAVKGVMERSDRPVIAQVSNVKAVASQVRPVLADALAEYGLALERFSIAVLRILKNCEYLRLVNDVARQRQTQRVAITGRAEEQARAMAAFGESQVNPAWAAQQQVDLMQSVAQNPAGGVAGMAAGLGVGLGTMGAFGQVAGQVAGGTAGASGVAGGAAGVPGDGVAVGAGPRSGGGAASAVQAAKPAAAGAAVSAGAVAPASAAAAHACPNCGAPVPAGAKFCPGCGAKQEAPEPEAPVTPSFCTECGAKLAPGTKFCPSCGHKIGA